MTSFLRMSVIASSLLAATMLAAVEPAVEQPGATDQIMRRIGERVDQFWSLFSAVTCTEQVTQQKREPGGKRIAQKQSTYDYLILLQRNGDDLVVEESRIPQGKEGKETDRAMLTTGGFSTLLLVLHPMFQPSYEFRRLPDESSDGRRFLKIAFSHIAGHRSPSVLQLRTRSYPIEWRGVAWIDAETYSVARIQVSLAVPMEDVGMQRLSSDVQYKPVTLQGEGDAPWLPDTATIEAATRRQRWHNSHHFTHYREFRVDTNVTIEAPK